MINLRIQLFSVLLAASVTAAVHASVFSVLGYNEQTLPEGDIGGEFKRLAVNISVRNTSTENSKLVDKLISPTKDVVQPKITKPVKKSPAESIDKPKRATTETLSIGKPKPTKPVVKKEVSESISTTKVAPKLELKPEPEPELKPEPEPKPVVQPQLQAQASSESPTLKEGLIKQQSRVSEAYKLALVKRLAAKKHYPIKARLAGIEGTASTRFSVDADGDLFDFELVASSGSAYLDKAVKKTFAKAFPLPRFITKLGSGQRQIFTLPIHFKIK